MNCSSCGETTHHCTCGTYQHSFGWALERLKEGRHVDRAGWNGKNMYLVLWHPRSEGELCTLPYIVMRTATGGFVPWLASQTDVLSEDWAVDPNGPPAPGQLMEDFDKIDKALG